MLPAHRGALTHDYGKDKQIRCSIETGGMNMKKIRMMALGLVLVCLFGLLPEKNVIQASADAPITYTLKYSDTDGSWKYEPNYPWDDSLGSGWISSLGGVIKDGDNVVIMGSDQGLILQLTQHLGSLTFKNSPNVIVTANGIDEVYVLENSVAAINGDVKNAYVYDNAICTFNNNVEYMEVVSVTYPLKATVTVMGTVGHLKAYDIADNNNARMHYEFYQFAAGKLNVEKGTLKTDAAYYSTEPAPVSDAAQAAEAAAQTSAADEYDKVPKTGDTTNYGWLLAVAAVCLTGGVCVRCMGRKKYCNEQI